MPIATAELRIRFIGIDINRAEPHTRSGSDLVARLLDDGTFIVSDLNMLPGHDVNVITITPSVYWSDESGEPLQDQSGLS